VEDLESPEAIVAVEVQLQWQAAKEAEGNLLLHGLPTSPLPHEMEKEALALASRDDSVSGESHFPEVMSEDLEHEEGLQHLYCRKMGAIKECIALYQT
jgi:hypothetical protein